MSILDNAKFTILVCELFYKKGLSQKEIAFQLGISRSQVCRIIANGIEKGYVSISINYPNSDEGEYQKLIADKYGISEVYVYDIGGLSGETAMRALAESSKDLFPIVVKDGAKVGVMAGKTICDLASSLPKSKNRNLKFIPLCGGTNSNGTEWQANSIAMKFAKMTNSDYYILNAPQYLNSIEAREVLEKEPSIKGILDLGKSCDTVLIGIGGVEKNSTTAQAGDFQMDEIAELKRQGVVATICCSYVNADGEIVESAIGKKIIGQRITDLGSARKIGIARGKSKVEAIRAVLKGGYLDVLITSLDTAKLLI